MYTSSCCVYFFLSFARKKCAHTITSEKYVCAVSLHQTTLERAIHIFGDRAIADIEIDSALPLCYGRMFPKCSAELRYIKFDL